MLSFERLQAFLNSNEVQLDIDVPGADSPCVPAVLMKRRVGEHAFLLYCYFTDASYEDHCGEWDASFNGDRFYRLMYYSPGREEVFITKSTSVQDRHKINLPMFLSVLREWYAEKNKADEKHLTAVGRKLSAMYVDELRQHYSDEDVLRAVNPTDYRAAGYLTTFGPHKDIKTAALADADHVPDIVLQHLRYITSDRNVFTDVSKPLAAYDEYYRDSDEDVYIANVYEMMKTLLYGDGYIFVPEKDPIMSAYAAYLKAKELWATHPLFAKHRAILQAVDSTNGKNVILVLKKPDKEFTQAYPCSVIRLGLNSVQGDGAGNLGGAEYYSHGHPSVPVQEIKSVCYRGKVLYNDPAL